MLNQPGQTANRSAELLKNLAEFSIKQFKTEQELINSVLNLIADTLQIRTPFLSSTMAGLFEVLNVVNRNGCTLEAGAILPLQDSYCSKISSSGEPLVVEDTRNHPFFAALQVTQDANIGSYIGVPIRFSNGHLVGTLCGIDPELHQFSAEDVQFLQILARSVAALLERKVGIIPQARPNRTEQKARRSSPPEIILPAVVNRPIVLIAGDLFTDRADLAEKFSAQGYQPLDIKRQLTLELLEETVEKYPPQLIVLIETDGEDNEVEVLAKFRPKYPATPVLFLTRQRLSQIRAYVSGATYCQLYAAGLDTFFSKAKAA